MGIISHIVDAPPSHTPCWLQFPQYIELGSGALISTLRPWVPLVKIGNDPGRKSYRALSPGDALRSEPGIMSGEPTAVLKAVAFDLLIGFVSNSDKLLSLTLLRSAIAGLEANEGSMMALDTVLRGLQVRVLSLEVRFCFTTPNRYQDRILLYPMPGILIWKGRPSFLCT